MTSYTRNINNIFYIFVTVHLIFWTLVPSLTNSNLPLDTIEALAWGSNLDWGFNKHPPMSAFFPEVFIKIFGWGMMGAAWATTLSYGFCASYIVYFFFSKHTSLHPKLKHFSLKFSLVKEITSLGSVTLTRQAMVSITVLLVNNILFSFGGESSIAVYAILSRMLMFATFPILGITQGFLPIAGFNYGAKNWIRVRNTINISIGYATFLASLIFAVIFFFAESIPNVFSDNQYVTNHAPTALRYVFVALPIVGIQLIGAAYFQAIGKALPALLLTLSRQGIFFIPLLFILPRFYGVDGVWMAFPIADVLSTIVTGFFLNREVSKLKTT